MHRVHSTVIGIVAVVAVIAGTSAALATSNQVQSLGQGYGYGYCSGPYQYQYQHQYQYNCPDPGPVTPTPPGPEPTPPGPGTQPPTQPLPVQPVPPVVLPEQLVPKAPLAPGARTIQLVGGVAASRFNFVASRGVSVGFPMREAGVRINAKLSVAPGVARKLGLRVPRGSRAVVIGAGSLTNRTTGKVIVKVPLTPAARTAFKRAGARVPSVAATLTLVLSKDGKSSTATKPLGFRR